MPMTPSGTATREIFSPFGTFPFGQRLTDRVGQRGDCRRPWPVRRYPRADRRWRSTSKRLDAVAKGLDDIAALPDPIGKALAEWNVRTG